MDPVLEDHVGMVDHPVDLPNEHVRQVVQQQIGNPTSTQLNYIYFKKIIFITNLKSSKYYNHVWGTTNWRKNNFS